MYLIEIPWENNSRDWFDEKQLYCNTLSLKRMHKWIGITFEWERSRGHESKVKKKKT